jgi:hypothetical protein
MQESLTLKIVHKYARIYARIYASGIQAVIRKILPYREKLLQSDSLKFFK